MISGTDCKPLTKLSQASIGALGFSLSSGMSKSMPSISAMLNRWKVRGMGMAFTIFSPACNWATWAGLRFFPSASLYKVLKK